MTVYISVITSYKIAYKTTFDDHINNLLLWNCQQPECGGINIQLQILIEPDLAGIVKNGRILDLLNPKPEFGISLLS